LTTRPRLLTTLALAVPLTLAAAGCGGSGTASTVAGAKLASSSSSAAIAIGATLSLTGSLSALAPPLEAGYQQEIADVNAAGGIAIGGTKEKLRLVVMNNGSDPDSVVERPLYKAAFTADGLDVVGDYTFPVGTTDFSAFIADAKRAGAQLLAGQLAPADGVALWKQLASSGFRPKAAFLPEAPDAGSWWQSLGRLAQGTLSDGYWSPGQASPGQLAAVASTLGQKYAGSPGYATAAVAYAVAQVLTDALARAGSASPGTLNAAIARTDAPTAAGLITFSPSTHTAITPYYITQWRNGKLDQVQPRVSGVINDGSVVRLGGPRGPSRKAATQTLRDHDAGRG
jgi:ABC-type branched-subunit amino acid transport system substrate-binding protein